MKLRMGHTKCFHFHPDGAPKLGEECPYGSKCNYAHPGDEQWDTAKTSPHYIRNSQREPGPLSHRGRRPSYGDRHRPRSRSRSRSRDNGWAGRRRYTSDSHSPIQRRRRDSIASSVASDSGDRRRESISGYNQPMKRAPTESPIPSKAPIPSTSGPSQPPPRPPQETPPFQPPSPPPASTHRPTLLERIKLEPDDDNGPIPPPQITTPVVTPAKFSNKNWLMDAISEPSQSMLPTPPTSSADNTSFAAMPPPPVPVLTPNEPPKTNMLPPPLPPVLPTASVSSPIRIPMTKPPSPAKPTMGPPPIPPTPRDRPVGLSTNDPKKDQQFWQDKIEQMYLAFEMRKDHERKTEELKQVEPFLNSTAFPSLDEAKQAKIRQRVETLELERQKAKAGYDARLIELTKLEIWPTDMVAKEKESVEDMRQMKEVLPQLQALAAELEELVRRQEPGASQPDGDAMDVDIEVPSSAPGPSSRPAKRRRREQSGSPSESPSDTDDDIDKLRAQLQDLEAKYSELDTGLEDRFQNQFDEWTDEIHETIEDKLTPLRSGVPTHQEVIEMKESIDELVKLADVIVPQIVELADSNFTKGTELAEARRNVDHSDTQIADLMTRLEIAETNQTATRQRLAELQHTYDSHIANPPQGPAPPLPSQEALFQALDEPLTDLVRQEFHKMAVPLRQEVEEMLRDGNAELTKSVWSSLASTLRMVETLSQRLGVAPPAAQGTQ